MARPGEVQQRAPVDAPHGEGAALQRLQQAAPLASQGASPTPNAPPTLQQPYPTAPPQGIGPPTGAPPITGDSSGGYDDQLFAPSDRPGEPVTHGAPFGPGANFVPHAGEDDHSFMLRVADQLSQGPTTQRVRLLAERIRLGE